LLARLHLPYAIADAEKLEQSDDDGIYLKEQ
jgi:hypothetical protein